MPPSALWSTDSELAVRSSSIRTCPAADASASVTPGTRARHVVATLAVLIEMGVDPSNITLLYKIYAYPDLDQVLAELRRLAETSQAWVRERMFQF